MSVPCFKHCTKRNAIVQTEIHTKNSVSYFLCIIFMLQPYKTTSNRAQFIGNKSHALVPAARTVLGASPLAISCLHMLCLIWTGMGSDSTWATLTPHESNSSSISTLEPFPLRHFSSKVAHTVFLVKFQYARPFMNLHVLRHFDRKTNGHTKSLILISSMKWMVFSTSIENFPWLMF